MYELNAGDSAGGHLSAALTLRWRHLLQKQANSTAAAAERLHPLKLQILIYPATQTVNLSTTSYLQNRAGPFLPKEVCARHLVWHAFGELVDSELDARLVRAAMASNFTTQETRARLAPLFLLDSEHVTYTEMLEAHRIRVSDVSDIREHDPHGFTSLYCLLVSFTRGL